MIFWNALINALFDPRPAVLVGKRWVTIDDGEREP